MTVSEYLEEVLASQTLADDGDELKALRKRRKDVEALLRKAFTGASPTIRYGGSMAKGTMIKDAYDLDVVCYFPHDGTVAGDTLEDIYGNVKSALDGAYYVEPKASALRIRGTGAEYQLDFHVDIVPGRYVDDAKSDTFLYQASGEKKRLKTNVQVHIEHVRDSGVRPAIRLMKLWRYRHGLQIKHFVLELLVIKLLKSKTDQPREKQLEHVWTKFRDNSDGLSVQDPANPAGNDLSAALDACRAQLSMVAGATLASIAASGWESEFGHVEEDDDDDGAGGKLASLGRAAAVIKRPSKPWLGDR